MELPDLNREPNSIVFAEQNYNGLEKDFVTIASSLLPSEEEASKWPTDKEYKVSFPASSVRENNQERIKTALQNLNKKTIIVIDDKKKSASFDSIYPECSLENGTITIYIRGKYIVAFSKISSGYSVYEMEEYLSLQSPHPKRLFEMFSSFVNRDIRTFETESDILKKQLGLADKYIGRPIDFKRFIIEPSIEQINEKTRLSIGFVSKRVKRKTHFIFSIDYKEGVRKTKELKEANSKPTPRQMTIEEGIENELNDLQKLAQKRARELGFTDKQIIEIIRPDRYEYFNKWWYEMQSEINTGKTSKEIARGAFYKSIKG